MKVSKHTATSFIVRGMDPDDKSWLRREAHQKGVWVEELVRRLIHSRRVSTESHTKLSPGISGSSMASIFHPRSDMVTHLVCSSAGIRNDCSVDVFDRHERYFRNDEPRPDPQVTAFLDLIADEGIGLSSASVWEVLDGIGRLEPSQRRNNLAERFRDLVKELFEDRVVEWSEVDAQACARIMEDQRRCGETLDEHIPDAFIAATATTRGLTVVTRNTSDFRNTGVKTVNPCIAGQ